MVAKRLLPISLFPMLFVVSNILQAYKVTIKNETDYPVEVKIYYVGGGDTPFNNALNLCGFHQGYLDPKSDLLQERESYPETSCPLRKVEVSARIPVKASPGLFFNLQRDYEPNAEEQIGAQTLLIEPADIPQYFKIRRK